MASAIIIASAAGCGGSAPAANTTPTTPNSSGTGAPALRATTTTRATINPSTSPAGALDESFGEDGVVMTDIDGHSDEAYGVVVQPDGKIVALGASWVFPQDKPRFALLRYNPDGSPDQSFGDGGRVIVGMTDDEWDYSMPHGLALQGDGKLVAAGTSYDQDAGHNVFAVARFNPDGTFDEEFGDGGRVLAPISTAEDASNEEAHALALAPDGKIVLAGFVGLYPADFAAVRLLPDGTPDESFGEGGAVVTDLGGDDKAAAVAVQLDGKVVLAGRGANEDDDWAMLRYTSDGVLDETFGDGGIVSTDLTSGEDYATGIVVQEDGGIVLGGVGQIGSVLCTSSDNFLTSCDRFAFALARYTSSGELDERFGDGGQAVYELDEDSGGYALALQPDGQLVMAGHYDNDDYAVLRANPDGSLDTGFGEGGLVRTPFGRGMDVANAVALQPGGMIVVAGSATVGDDALNENFGITRYGGR
jgi:uncharacterized delta-60 repeat protein